MRTYLDQFVSDEVIEILSNAENLKLLSDNFTFKNDFNGQNNKEEAITWLIIVRDFRMQGSYDLATHTILDNGFKISGNCATFF